MDPKVWNIQYLQIIGWVDVFNVSFQYSSAANFVREIQNLCDKYFSILESYPTWKLSSVSQKEYSVKLKLSKRSSV